MFGAYYFDYLTTSIEITNSPILLGIGENSILKNTIIDKNAKIGNSPYITPHAGLKAMNTTEYR
jgi:ADP-glucose pyrophosphorylase